MPISPAELAQLRTDKQPDQFIKFIEGNIETLLIKKYTFAGYPIVISESELSKAEMGASELRKDIFITFQDAGWKIEKEDTDYIFVPKL